MPGDIVAARAWLGRKRPERGAPVIVVICIATCSWSCPELDQAVPPPVWQFVPPSPVRQVFMSGARARAGWVHVRPDL
jgi:hypothetical protein